ncbi:MAG: hypothetical protein QOD37_883 [Gaiellales bacterium]|nr:hypothetical protein [Gaiellales bacterium]
MMRDLERQYVLGRPRLLQSFACVAAAGLLMLGVTGATARSDVPHASVGRASSGTTSAAAQPLRAFVYETAPAPAHARLPAKRPAPSPKAASAGNVRFHLAALEWGRADAAIVPWDAPGTLRDRRLAAVLSGIAATGAHVRAVAAIERRSGSMRAQLQSLAKSRAGARGYLRVGGRPAVFVALQQTSSRGCAQSRAWRAAARGLWLVQATFRGYEQCRATADAWYADPLHTRTARAGGSFSIRPGSWPQSARAPKLKRSVSSWQRSIAQMTASHARLQIIDSLNDWSLGTATEASPSWPSTSGFGSYLDALHAQAPTPAEPAPAKPAPGQPPGSGPAVAPPPGSGPPAAPPPAPPAPPTVDTPVVSGVTAHQATLTSHVSAGTTAATVWVEFGRTTAYGQKTPSTSLGAGSPARAVAIVMSALSASVQEHARVVVVSAVGRAASPDVVFSTPADPLAVHVAAAGDIACDPTIIDFNAGQGTATTCRQLAVSSAILPGGYRAVLPLGDEQYNAGTAAAFAASYKPSWGRLNAIAHPVVGNHEYGSPGAAPYFAFFGASAGTAGQGWYSFDVGSWHLIALNSNCARIAGGCGPGSPQEEWLRADLAAHPVRCTLAYWHHPLFTSGQEGPTPETSTFWNDLIAAGADIVLNGHEHHYERFAPQTTTGQPDAMRGLRQFIVGTGGVNHMSFKAATAANSEVRDSTSFGFLDLTLGDQFYSWRFVPTAPDAFSDSGTGSCH